MNETMAKALFSVGQAMHGRRVTIRLLEPRPGVGIEVLHCAVALIQDGGECVEVWVNGVYIEKSDDPATVAEAAIVHLVHSG